MPREEAALLLTVGLVLGVFPIVWAPTFLCLIAAYRLRLNGPVLQVLNSILSPLQLALLLPLGKIGAWLCHGVPAGNASALGRISVAVAHAVVGWMSVCVPAGVLLYFSLVLSMRWVACNQRGVIPFVLRGKAISRM